MIFSRPKHLSKKGAEFIARFEGYRSTPYNDAANNATIGIGHLLHKGPVNVHDKGLVWSKAHALKVLAADAEKAAAIVRAIRPPILSQSRFDALVSLAFNLGVGILEPSHDIGKAVRRVNRRGAAIAFLEYDHAGGVQMLGLTRRRRAEAKLWLTGQYS